MIRNALYVRIIMDRVRTAGGHQETHHCNRGKMDTDLSLEEEARALSEAQAKGLPEGWTVKLDVSKEAGLVEEVKIQT
jgi:hypothetical protein